MTPSPEEIEAAAKAAYESETGRRWKPRPRNIKRQWRTLAEAALTAAEKVREDEGIMRHATQQEGPMGAAGQCECADRVAALESAVFESAPRGEGMFGKVEFPSIRRTNAE